jgi:dihydrofolate reductase
MGRIIVEQIISADGFAEARKGGIDFFESAGDFSEMEPEQLEMLANVDAIVFGANTYRMFAKYWPDADPEKERVAEPINRLPKHVFSSKLEKAPWGKGDPVTIERDSVQSTMVALRERYAKDIIVWGSLTLTEALFDENLIDVLRLRVVPILVGAGRSIAPPDLDHTKLQLVASRAYPRGHLSMTYALR